MTKLIYVDDSQPGLTRKGAGKGWAYYDVEGQLIRDQAERQRLNAIALPPGTRWLTRDERGLIEFLEEAPKASDLLAVG